MNAQEEHALQSYFPINYGIARYIGIFVTAYSFGWMTIELLRIKEFSFLLWCAGVILLVAITYLLIRLLCGKQLLMGFISAFYARNLIRYGICIWRDENYIIHIAQKPMSLLDAIVLAKEKPGYAFAVTLGYQYRDGTVFVDGQNVQWHVHFSTTLPTSLDSRTFVVLSDPHGHEIPIMVKDLFTLLDYYERSRLPYDWGCVLHDLISAATADTIEDDDDDPDADTKPGDWLH